MNDYIEPLFNMHKIKFEKLDEIADMNMISAEHVNIFISLEMVIRLLLNANVDNRLRAAGYSGDQLKAELISGVINLGQHYRIYFNRKRRKSIKVYLYWNFPRAHYLNREYIPKYRNDYDTRVFRSDSAPMITETLQEILPALKSTVACIDGLYVIDGGVVESSLVPYIIMKNSEEVASVANVLISRFQYDYQYIRYGFSVLVPAQANSVALSIENVASQMKQKSRIKNPMAVPGELISAVLALLGDDYRGIPKLPGYGLSGVTKMISKAIDELIISSHAESIEMLTPMLEAVDTPADVIRQFALNYRCTNLDYQLSELTPSHTAYIMNQIIDKFNDDKIKELNETVFKMCPLMLVRTRTEQVRNSECFHYDVKSIF